MSLALIDPRLKLRHLRCFLEVARLGGVAKAAAALNMSQPAATKTIQELEAVLGVALFDRSRRALTLTGTGEMFRLHAANGMAALYQGVQGATQGAASGMVRVGALPTVSTAILPKALAMLTADGAVVSTRVITGPNAYLIDLLRAGEIDFVVGRMADPQDIAGLSFEHLYSELICVVVRKDHPLTRQSAPEFSALADYTWLMPPPDAVIRPVVERLLRAHDVPVAETVLETVSDSFARNYLRATDAIWFISEGVVTPDCRDGLLAVLPFAMNETLGPVGLTTRVDVTLSPAAASILTAIRYTARNLVAPAGDQGQAANEPGGTAARLA
ncbi:MAG: pca operon transcription factor PcaQ [Devosia sp.]